MNVIFRELLGELKDSAISAAEAPGCVVVRSSIAHGAARGPSWAGVTARFVGRGTEHYEIGGRHFRVGQGQIMIAPQNLGSTVEIRRDERDPTLGLCIFLPKLPGEVERLVDAPIVLPATCDLGAALKTSLVRLQQAALRPNEPKRIADQTRSLLCRTILKLDSQIDAVAGLKRRTRVGTVQRMNLARAYLHLVTDRPVPLNELAREIAVSPFHLLRNFRECFGDTPAGYHRRLRLTLACQAAEQEGRSYSFVADQFGFAGGASFSHAHRRAFGEAPSRKMPGSDRG